MLSLPHPLDRYRTPSAIGSAIGRLLSRPMSHPNTQVGVLNRLVLNRLGAQPRDSGAIVSKSPLKTSAERKHDRSPILNRVLDRDCNSQPRPRPRLNSQLQGATKPVVTHPFFLFAPFAGHPSSSSSLGSFSPPFLSQEESP